jgi:hypothetical protein
VEKVEITAHDVTWGGNRFTAYDTAGYILGDKIFAGNNTPGVYSADVATAVASPENGAGIATVKLETVEGEYIAYSMKVQFRKNNGCKVQATMYGQGWQPWRDSLYDHDKTRTIRNIGCALTSMAMGMSALGTTIDPGALNHLMKVTPGGFDGTSVTWEKDIEPASAGSAAPLTFSRFSTTASMKKAICAGNPVIVGVKLAAAKKKPYKVVPGHFVLVNEVKADGSFWIQDPGDGQVRPLSFYKAGYQVRGAVIKRKVAAPPTASMRARSLILATAAEPGVDDIPMLNVVTTNNQITVTAADGSVSIAGAAAPDSAGIAGSFAQSDGLTDDEDSLSVSADVHSTVGVPAVADAQYTVDILPAALGFDTLTIHMPSLTTGERLTQRLPYFGVPGRSVQFLLSVTATGLTGTRAVTGGVFILPSCDLHHAIMNVNSTAVDATYLVEETGETGTVQLAPRPAKLFFSLTELTTATKGTLRLTSNGHVLARLAAIASCEHPE